MSFSGDDQSTERRCVAIGRSYTISLYAGRRINVNPVVVVSIVSHFLIVPALEKTKKKVGDDPISVQSPLNKKKNLFFSIHSLLLRLFALSSIC
jgi:hypothetical protein